MPVEILLLTVCFLITLWLLTGGLREWLKKEWNFLQHAALMDGPTAIPIIGNALIFACSYNGDYTQENNSKANPLTCLLRLEILPRLIKLAKPYENPFRFWLGTKLVIGVKNPRDIEVSIIVFNEKCVAAPWLMKLELIIRYELNSHFFRWL